MNALDVISVVGFVVLLLGFFWRMFSDRERYVGLEKKVDGIKVDMTHRMEEHGRDIKILEEKHETFLVNFGELRTHIQYIKEKIDVLVQEKRQ